MDSVPRRALVLYNGHTYFPLSLRSDFLTVVEYTQCVNMYRHVKLLGMVLYYIINYRSRDPNLCRVKNKSMEGNVLYYCIKQLLSEL